jgi:hypothetical protein
MYIISLLGSEFVLPGFSAGFAKMYPMSLVYGAWQVLLA